VRLDTHSRQEIIKAARQEQVEYQPRTETEREQGRELPSLAGDFAVQIQAEGLGQEAPAL
jgi:hypothetical protein